MKKISVTGCNGQLGRAVNQQYAGSTEYELVNTDVAELDITRVDKVLELAAGKAGDDMTVLVAGIWKMCYSR